MILSREDGRVVCERCVVAETPLRRLRGLLGRRGLPLGEGLLLRPASSVHTLFMHFPIDVVFLDADSVVLHVEPGLRPWRAAGRRGAKSVLELPSGECLRRSIRPGDRLLEAEPGAVFPLGRPWVDTGKHSTKGGQMATIEQSIEVEVPVRTAYDQWTQFEEFPQFMDGVEQVQQLDDERLRWVAAFGGKRHEWEARITEQKPDERIAWSSTDGKANAGVVTFHRLDDDRTKVMVQMDYETEGLVENVGSAIGADDRRIKGDLERFKQLIEERGTETGAWRGEIDNAS